MFCKIKKNILTFFVKVGIIIWGFIMMEEFNEAVNANVYMFSNWKVREVYYKDIKRSVPRTLSWFDKRYGVEFCVFEKLKDKGRQRACIRCNECFLRIRKRGGDWLYDDEVRSPYFDYGVVYPVW